MEAMPRIDLIPGPYSTAPAPTKTRWRLLIITFLITSIIGLSYVWLRSPVYHSYAIMHLSYSQPNLEEISTVAAEQLNIHHQRLTSQRVIVLLAEQLFDERQLQLSPKKLNDILSVESIADSRLLKLSAIDTEPTILLPIVESWVKLYFSLQSSEEQESSNDEQTDLQNKLAVLEGKISAKRLSLTEFTAEHQIISLERDENRVLSQIKGLSNSLDITTEEKAAAIGQLKAIKSATAEGKIMVRPQDQSSLDNMEDRALALEEQLFQLSQQYTPAYMAIDPTIKGIKNNLVSLKRKTRARRAESQETYLNVAKQTVQALTAKEANIRGKLTGLQNQAQNFNHKLSEYNSMNLDLEQIQLQTQMVRDQLIQAEVRKPYQAKIDMLEAPLYPEFPIGPNYPRDSGIAVLIAVFISLATVGIFALINRQQRSDVILTPYPVANPQQQIVQEQQQLSDDSLSQIVYQEAREISVEECRRLLHSASLHCKLALTLMLSGVGSSELLRLTVEDFDANHMVVPGQHQRRLALSELAIETVKQVSVDLRTGLSLWETPTDELLELPELEQMLQHAASDARLNDFAPIGFKDIRHTYLLFLARQGASLNEIEQVAGYLSAKEMEHCQQISKSEQLTDLAEIVTHHPALTI
jgi:polysaccharide biosynthesis transport protein